MKEIKLQFRRTRKTLLLFLIKKFAQPSRARVNRALRKSNRNGIRANWAYQAER